MDLVITEAFHANLLSGLSAAELAAALSIFLYETRRELPLRIPNSKFQERVSEIAKIWLSVHEDELDSRIDETRALDLGFVWGIYRWASGSNLHLVLHDSEMSIGDFIRAVRQIMDLLRQLLVAFPSNRELFLEAIKLLDRGIIASVGSN